LEHYNVFVRDAWNEFRQRWKYEWYPWLENHPRFVGVMVTLVLSGIALLLKVLFSPRTFHWSWSDLAWIGTLALVFGAPVLAWWITGLDIRRRRRRDENLREQKICLHCGYDMRATPERCPECGKRADEPVDLFR
jgi:hypothetical protein